MGKIMAVIVVTIMVMLALVSTKATATLLFSNTGTVSGWDFIIQDHNGDVQEVLAVTYRGLTSLRMTQVYDASYTGTYRAEVGKNGAYQRGDVRYYGFAFRLQPNWNFTTSQRYLLEEFVANFSDYGCGGEIRSSAVWLVGDKLYSQVKTGPVCDPTTTVFPDLATVSAGAPWHTVIIGASWTSDSTGFYKLWFDSNLVLDASNIATTLDTNRAFQFRVGLVPTDWHDQGTLVGSQSSRRVWIDEIRIATTLIEANPSL